MRQFEDKELRDFEIREWFYALQKHYLDKGMDMKMAANQAYEDIGVRFCLRKSSIRKYKDAGACRKNRKNLMFEVKSNLSRLKEIISLLDEAFEH